MNTICNISNNISHTASIINKNWFLYAEMFFFILLNGSPIKDIFDYPLIIGITFVNILFIFQAKLFYKLKEYVLLIIVLAIIMIVQQFVVEKPDPSSSWFLRVVYGGTVLLIFGERFRWFYFYLLYLLSFIGLILWGIYAFTDIYVSVIDTDVSFVTGHSTHSLVIWGTHDEDLYAIHRNKGPFWEPGAYACYLLLAFVMYFHDFAKQFKTHKIQFFILLLSLLSTMSTTGYVVGMALFFMIFILNRKFNIGFLIVATIVLLGFVYIGNETGILADKIEEQLETIDMTGEDYDKTRMAAFFFDLNKIVEHPWVGNGFNQEMLWGGALAAQMEEGFIHKSGNGFTDVTKSLGIPFLLLWVFIFFKKNQHFLGKRQSVLIIISVLLILQGESLFNYTLMCVFPFIDYKIQI